MPSESVLAALRGIAYHIDVANHFVGHFDATAFRDALRTVYAVTRCVEIISEASRCLSDEMQARDPSIAWKNMA